MIWWKKIERKSISRNGAYNSYNNIAKKGENIEKLRQTKNRKKKLKKYSLLKKIFDEQPDTTDMPDLGSEESAAQGRNQQGQGQKNTNPKPNA